MVAMGVIAAGELGIEAAGTVLQVGTAVNDLKVGDRVVVTRSGCFATRTTVPRANCVRISDSLGFGEAATMYGVYCTSVLSLMNIAKIEKGNVCSLTIRCLRAYALTSPSTDCPYPLCLWWHRSFSNSDLPNGWR